MPTPNDSEDKETFMGRCMADETMISEYPDGSQRYAICQSQWGEKSMPQMKTERRYTPERLSVERVKDQPPRIVGYAAVYYDGTERTQYELWDGAVERIMPGAFDAALATDVRGLFNHDPNLILGRTSAGTMGLTADSRGLRYSIDAPDSPNGENVRAAVERGDVTGSSFSFIVNDVRWLKEESLQVREILGVELFDVGPVTFPAYSATTAGVRAMGDLETVKAELAEIRIRESSLAAESRRRKIRARLIELGLTT